jgi:isoleucyl-tRNA synthetase
VARRSVGRTNAPGFVLLTGVVDFFLDDETTFDVVVATAGVDSSNERFFGLDAKIESISFDDDTSFVVVVVDVACCCCCCFFNADKRTGVVFFTAGLSATALLTIFLLLLLLDISTMMSRVILRRRCLSTTIQTFRLLSTRPVDDDKHNFAHTLLLPKTTFALRSDALEREATTRVRSAYDQLYAWQWNSRPHAPLWITHDGPPYANGQLHIGHALNKILKDIVSRYKLARGFRVHFVPGWDMHGLPIELKAAAATAKAAKAAKSKASAAAAAVVVDEETPDEAALRIRQGAADYALGMAIEQSASFRSWAVLGDWERPYLTLQPEYEAQQLDVFSSMLSRGLIYRGAKPVFWSPSSRTALAEAELEYRDDHVSTAAYVALRVQQCSPALENLIASDGASPGASVVRLLVWTTTPWTLPANAAVCVGEKIDYVVVKGVVENELVVVASERVAALTNELQWPSVAVLGRLSGADLVGSTYAHPLRGESCPVFVASHVASESGTGLVHTAPGHGVEDYVVCATHGIAPFCPVDERGRYTEAVGEAAMVGLDALDGTANDAVLSRLRTSGQLLHSSRYVHRYPYDWRTNKPVLLRATAQWFVRLTALRDSAREALRTVAIDPEGGRARLDSMLAARDDWCLSRQRVWGVPIPVFYHVDTGEALMTPEIIAHVRALVSHHGSDCWWSMSEAELLPPSLRADAALYRKGRDTMDVWFDSGTSWAGALRESGIDAPSDLVLEGSDQHRGWFQSSLLTSVGARGIAPYKRILTHGFVLDERGRKMAKSLGNVVEPTWVTNAAIDGRAPYGVDVLRLWCATVDSRADVQIGESTLADVASSLRRLRNTLRFLLANVSDFGATARASVLREHLEPVDRYALHLLSEAASEADAAYESFSFATVPRILNALASNDLSAFYLDIIKDRLYADARDAPSRRAAQLVCEKMLLVVLKLLAPIAPHTADEAFQHWRGVIDAGSAAREVAPENAVLSAGWIDRELGSGGDYRLSDESAAEWAALRDLRTMCNAALEQQRERKIIGKSLQADVEIQASGHLFDVLERYQSSLAAFFIVSDVRLVRTASAVPSINVTLAKLARCGRCWRHVAPLPLAEPLCGRCATVLATTQSK